MEGWRAAERPQRGRRSDAAALSARGPTSKSVARTSPPPTVLIETEATLRPKRDKFVQIEIDDACNAAPNGRPQVASGTTSS